MNLEVDVSHDGYVPVLYQVLPGNPADITRPWPPLRALLRFLARPELAERRLPPLLVSDCKMVTPEAAMNVFQAQVLAALGWPPPERYAGLSPLER